MQCASSIATMHTLRCKAGSASNRLHSGDATVSGDIKTKILLNNYFNLYEISVSGDIKTKILLNNYFNLYEIRQTNQM